MPFDLGDFEARLRDLVAVPTVGRERVSEVLDRVGREAAAASVRATAIGGADGVRNLYLETGPAGGAINGGGLVLCGHVDVVPATEPDWSHDPFEMADRGDRWSGRGTADMKGFVVLALQALVARARVELAAPLGVLLTYDEEVGSKGVQTMLGAPLPDGMPRSVLVGEPTELVVVPRHKGHLRLALDFEGVPAHSGYPDRGRNALEPAAEAVVALAALRREMREERLPSSVHFPETPYPALSVGTFHGGEAVNVIPDRARVEIGVRMLPGMDEGEVRDRVEAAVRTAVGAADWTLELVNSSPPLDTPDDAPLVRALLDATGAAETRSASFSSDAGTLARLGLQPVLFGPGSIEVAHRADEHLPKDQVREAARVLDVVIDGFCGTAGGPHPIDGVGNGVV